MSVFRTETILGVVKSDVGNRKSPFGFMKFLLVGQEKTKLLMIEDKLIEVRSQEEIVIEEGDKIIVAGQYISNTFVAWVYKNLGTEKTGGINLKHNLFILSFRLIMSLLYVYLIYLNMFSLWTSYNAGALLNVGVFFFFLIFFSYKPIVIYLANKKFEANLEK